MQCKLLIKVWKTYSLISQASVGPRAQREFPISAWKFYMWEIFFFSYSNMEEYHMSLRQLYKLLCDIHALSRRFSQSLQKYFQEVLCKIPCENEKYLKVCCYFVKIKNEFFFLLIIFHSFDLFIKLVVTEIYSIVRQL